MATIEGEASGLAEIAQLAGESVGPWLRQYPGYRGVFVFTDEGSRTSRVITLWDSPESEAAARASRGDMRDQIARLAGMEVVSFEVYDVPVHEVVSGDEEPA